MNINFIQWFKFKIYINKACANKYKREMSKIFNF